MKPLDPIKLKNGYAHIPRKRFGQNFLHDKGVIDQIIAAIAPSPNDHLLEIGPGHGALTEPLIKSKSKLDCVEIDQDLVKFLNERYCSSVLNVIAKDILKFDIKTLDPQPHSLRVVGNLPYNISTPVLFHLLKSHELISDMTFMLQLEVVQRITARAGEKNYGRLGLMLQYHCEVEHLFNVPSTAFTPVPKVGSAIVRLKPYKNKPIEANDPKILEIVIRTAFNQRRKTLRNSLKTLLRESKTTSSVDLSLRPETLSLGDYIEISNSLTGDKHGKL